MWRLKLVARVRSSLALWLAALALGCNNSESALQSEPALQNRFSSEELGKHRRIDFEATSDFSVNINSCPIQSLWKRELMRQSLLLAARAEMGYTTSDNVL